MEDSKIIDWILKRKNELNLKVFELTELPKYLSGYSDYSIEFRLGKMKFSGRGTDKNDEIAFLKAFSEALEKFISHSLNLETTSGVAVHKTLFACRRKASFELIERDSFLCHFLLGLKLVELKNDFVKKINSSLKLKELEIKFYEISSINNGYCIMAMMHNNLLDKSKQKLIFGICYSECLEEAINHSAVECVRDYVEFAHGNEKTIISLEEFRQKKVHEFNDHKNLGLNEAYVEKYYESRINEGEIKDINSDSISFIELQIDNLLQDCPLVAGLADSLSIQKLWVGNTELKNINLNRMNEILPNPQIINLPHFFN